jgi:oxygen-dependent protoporphyrinogen oxidase
VSPDPAVDLVVVGGGVAGLAAAWEAVQLGASVTVLEAAERIGGKLVTSDLHVDGSVLRIDEGADAFLARVPDAVGLCRELGLDDEFVTPATGRAHVWFDGALRPLPEHHVLGVPLDADEVAATGLLSAAAVERLRTEPEHPGAPPVGDVSVGDHLGERLGREVVDHLVGPLVGGISAGDVDRLSLEAVTPQLNEAARRGGSLLRSLLEQRAASDQESPVFHGLRGGSARLVEVLSERLTGAGARLETSVDVRDVSFDDDGRASIRTDGRSIDADGVVLATPAAVAAGLLDRLSPQAAEELRSIPTTSVALVTLVYDRSDVPGPLDGSGFLVPRSAGLFLTAASWGSNKWAHWDDGRHVVLRASAGHRNDGRVDDLDDGAVAALLRADLATTMGIVAEPRATRVSRWTDAFPQYEVGHLERLERIDAALHRDAPRVRLAGMSYRGVGIPASIRSGRTAARSLLTTR